MKSKTKPVLFVDFDDVLVLTRPTVLKFVLNHYGIKIPDTGHLCGDSLEEIVISLLPENKRMKKGVFYEHMAKYFLTSEELHNDLPPIEGSIEAIAKLSQKFELWVATARQETSRPVVEKILDKFFKGRFLGAHFVWKHMGNQKFKGTPKRDFVATFKNRCAFIDDNPIEIRKMIGTTRTFLFDPQGIHRDIQGVSRVSSWETITDTLL